MANYEDHHGGLDSPQPKYHAKQGNGSMRPDPDNPDLMQMKIKGQWLSWNPELRDYGHPTEETKKTDRPLLGELQRSFHDRVIKVGSNKRHVRMVGWANLIDYDNNGEEGKITALWFPDDDFDKNTREFNLVFSLASNGSHYLVRDHDEETRGTTSNIWIPSTSHWHEYGTMSLSWNSIVAQNAANIGYQTQIMRSGMAGLRPPWIFKNDPDGEIEFKTMQAYGDLEPWKYIAKEQPEDELAGWDALGWDDE